MLLPQYFYNIAAGLESLLSVTFALSSLRRQRERLGKMAQARKQEKGAGERKWDDKSVK